MEKKAIFQRHNININMKISVNKCAYSISCFMEVQSW